MSDDKTFAETRVVKRFRPGQPGAVKLAQRFGPALACVRYRHDATGAMRYTTVELVVETVPVVRRGSQRASSLPRFQVVAIRVGQDEIDVRKLIIRHGAVWDAKLRLWYVSKATAESLDLVQRIV